jgi:hypothetical protein
MLKVAGRASSQHRSVGVLADQPRSDFVPDHALDPAMDVVLIAGEDLARDALVHVDAGDHGGAVRHLVVASAV